MIVVIVAWKSIYLKDNSLRVLVRSSVTLNQFLQLSEIFVPILREGLVLCPAYLTQDGCEDSFG